MLDLNYILLIHFSYVTFSVKPINMDLRLLLGLLVLRCHNFYDNQNNNYDFFQLEHIFMISNDT